MLAGRVPVSRLLVIQKLVIVEILKREEGIVPVRLFQPSEMKTKFVNRPSSLGIVPLMLFIPKEIFVRDERLPKEAGMNPVKLFEYN
ncbi:hypothetical protein LguiB_021149 [Lonicera macranthoides]